MEGYLHGAEVNFRRLTSEPLFSAFSLLYAWPKRFNGGLQGLNLKSDNFIRNPKNVIDAGLCGTPYPLIFKATTDGFDSFKFKLQQHFDGAFEPLVGRLV